MSVPCEVPARIAPHAPDVRLSRRRRATSPRAGRLALVESLPRPVAEPAVDPAPPRRGPQLRALGECGPRVVRAPELVAAPPEPALRLTARGRRIVAGLVVTVALVTVGIAAWRLTAMVSGPDSPIPADAPATVVVQPGDSLWSIARTVAPDEDARAVVQELLDRNRLDSSQVRVGERLVVAGQ